MNRRTAPVPDPVPTMRRWVKRNGLVVEFGNVVGPFVGGTYRYVLPTATLADRFEQLVRSTDKQGNPAPVPSEKWERWRVEGRLP